MMDFTISKSSGANFTFKQNTVNNIYNTIILQYYMYIMFNYRFVSFVGNIFHFLCGFPFQTLLAIHEAEKMLADGKGNASNSRCESVYGNLLILSLGTGAAEPQPGNRIDTGTPLEWLIDFVYQSSPLVDVMMRASDSMVETYTTSLLQTYNSQDNYLRIQVRTDCIFETCLFTFFFFFG